MKKNNEAVSVKKQRKKLASKARRKRRVERRKAEVEARVRKFRVLVGQLRSQNDNLTKELRRYKAQDGENEQA